jgi:NAD(P)H-hydrate epimerase
MLVLDREKVRSLLPARPEDGHKGVFGHLFVLAGSRGFSGAAKLAAEAAGRSGVGLVTVGVPGALIDVVAAGLMEAMTRAFPASGTGSFAHDALEPALAFAMDKHAVVLGPGLGQQPATRAFARDFACACPVPLLVDADALNALSEAPEMLQHVAQPCVLTPHPGEMARLLDNSTSVVQADREKAARALAERTGAVAVLKGHETLIVAADGRIARNTTGNSGLAKGGTGDVLSGVIGGLLAQRMEAFDAACLGVYLHGLAGDIAAQRKTARGMIARDVIEALPDAWRALEE